jgi:flagellar assembly protein FliH
MLSRVLDGDDAESTLLVWPRSGSLDSAAGREAAAQTAEISAVIEQRALEAYQSGVRDGEALGMQKAQGQVRDAVERLAATVSEVADARGEVIRQAEEDIVQLSIEIARRILHRELSIDTSALGALIRAALEKLRSQEIYRVRVHPDLEPLVRACLQQIGRDAGIEIVGDVAQSRGGAVFEISRGALDASVDTQLREIERGLADQLGDRR